MNRWKQICLTVLALAILSGQFPYQSAYCGMMKHRIDSAMLQRCVKHRSSENGVSQVRLVPQRMMKVFVKPTLATFEHHQTNKVSSDLPVLHLAAVITDDPTSASAAGMSVSPSPPISDITILTLNLRI